MEVRTAPHPAALKAASSNEHTQLVGLDGSGIVWLGAVGEDLLSAHGDPLRGDERNLLGGVFHHGRALWRTIRPGPLYPRGSQQISTVYAGDRPWLVVGELPRGGFVAAPLNEASNAKWYTPVISTTHLLLLGGKDSQLELAHLWSFPGNSKLDGTLHPDGRAGVEQALRRYFDLA
jgi:hypothetical protein